MQTPRTRASAQGVQAGSKLDHLDKTDVVARELGNDTHFESLEADNANPRTCRDSYAGPKFVDQDPALFTHVELFFQALIRWCESLTFDQQSLPLGDFEHAWLTGSRPHAPPPSRRPNSSSSAATR